MAVTTAVLSGSITDIVGDLDTKYLARVVVVIEANTEGSLLLDTAGDRLMAGPKRVAVDRSSGAYSITLPKTDSADIVPAAGRLYRVHLVYPSGIPGAGNVHRSSPWWAFTAAGSLSDADKWAGLEVTAVSAELLATLAEMVTAAETARDQAQAVGNTNDGIMTGVDANASSAFRVQQDARLSATYVARIEAFASFAIDDGGAAEDWSPAIQAALDAGHRSIELSGRYYACRQPIVVPANSGTRIFSRAAKKGSVLNFFIPAGNESRAAIEYTSATLQSAGIAVENVWVKGNNSVCHGIHLKYVSHPNIRNTVVEGFKGAGLLCDWVQDGVLDIDVQDCGRTTGDYALLADRSNNALTTYAPIHFIATTDHNNMLRISGQHEQNKVSPYVWVNDPGAIGLWFDEVHAEVREAGDFNSFDYLLSEGADLEFTGMAVAATFREGFLLKGSGRVVFRGGRYLRSVKHIQSNVSGAIEMSNVYCGDVSWVALSGEHKIANSTLGDVSIAYSAGGPARFTGCTMGDVTINFAGTGNTGVVIDNCTMASYASDINAADLILRDSKVTGALEARAVNSRVERVTYGSLTYVNQIESSFVPVRKTITDTAPPIYGAWSVGDRCENSAPAASGVMGWVCTTAGSPGTWKSYGAISA